MCEPGLRVSGLLHFINSALLHLTSSATSDNHCFICTKHYYENERGRMARSRAHTTHNLISNPGDNGCLTIHFSKNWDLAYYLLYIKVSQLCPDGRFLTYPILYSCRRQAAARGVCKVQGNLAASYSSFPIESKCTLCSVWGGREE